MTVQLQDKKRQHYVWKHYLKPWSVNGKLWCKRNGSVFESNLRNIGQEKFFYKSVSLNAFEDKVIKSIIKKFHPSTHDLHLKTYDFYVETTNGSDYHIKNGIEDYHSFVESSAITILSKLYDKDLSFLEDCTQKVNFSYYLGMQYTRTKQTLARLAQAIGSLSVAFPQYTQKINSSNISKIINLLTADTIGNWINSEANFYIIENKTHIELITGDQPIYNLHMGSNEFASPPNNFELYYPISPKLALIISKKQNSPLKINSKEIDRLNHFISNIANDQIYSKTKELLQRY